MDMSIAHRHQAIVDHIAELLDVCCKGVQEDPDSPLSPALIEPAVLLLLSTYPDCPEGTEVRDAMEGRSGIDPRIARKLADHWTGWCKLLHTAIPMGAITIDEPAFKRLRSPALNELLVLIGPVGADRAS